MKALKITSDLLEIQKIRTFLRKSLKEVNITEEDVFFVELSLLEMCINVMSYAYPEDKGDISLKIWQEDEKIFFEIRDWGVPFNPRKSKVPNIHEIIKEGRKGGLGIFLSRTFMDGFNYRRENDQNVLVMFKKIGSVNDSGSV